MDKKEHLCNSCTTKETGCKIYEDIKESPLCTITGCPNYKKVKKDK